MTYYIRFNQRTLIYVTGAAIIGFLISRSLWGAIIGAAIGYFLNSVF